MIATQRVLSRVTGLTCAAVASMWISVAWGLGLGSLEVHSNLDQPLDGVIELRLAQGDDISSIDARVASREEFEDLGIEFPNYLNSIRLIVEDRAGTSVLRVLSESIINEPFVHLLVRVDWSGGSFLREYTALIDPPIYASDTPAAISQPRAVEQTQSYTNEDAQRLEPLAQTTPETFSSEPEVSGTPAADVSEDYKSNSDYISLEDVQASADPAPAPVVAEGDLDAQYGPVVAGESLSVIASELQSQFPDLSIYQIMKVMFEENEGAFINGNINGLLKGSILKIGDLNAIRAVELADARDFYQDQLQDWNPAYLIADSSATSGSGADDSVRVAQDDYAFSDELNTNGYQSNGDASTNAGDSSDAFRVGAASDAETFVSNSQSDSREGEVIALRSEITQLETTLASSSQENQELTERISILEGQLSDMNRLMTLGVEDADLANLETTLANNNDLESKDAAAEDLTADALDGFSTEIAEPEAGESSLEILDLDAQDEALSTETDLISSIDVVEEGIEEVDTTDTATVAPRSIKVKSSQGFIGNTIDAIKDSGLALIVAGVGGLLLAGLALLVYRRRRADEEFEVSMLSLDSATDTESNLGDEKSSGFGASLSVNENSRIDKETSFLTVYSDSDAVVQADEVDPIAEADVYIAYGRDEQAEEVLLDGITTSPTRIDIKHKLLSLYHKNENTHGFERIAEELYAQRDLVSDSDWANVIAMGQEISPENPLFDDAMVKTATALTPKSIPLAPAPAKGEAEAKSADKSGLVNFDAVKSELSELDEVQFNALDVSPESSGGRANPKNVEAKPKPVEALDEDEIELLYDLDEGLTLTADDVSYDIDNNEFTVGSSDKPKAKSKPAPKPIEENSAINFDVEPSVSPISLNSASSNTEDLMSDLDVASSYDEARTQFELAKVFVDLGDEDGAKKILRELAKADDIDDDVLSEAMALLDSIDS